MADTTKKAGGGWLETIKIVVEALLIALVIRTFLFQPFNIPSGSLIPTLLVGDYLFVSKYSYGYSRFSIPFDPPLFSGRIWGAEPKRGDIVVFKLPTDTSKDYIKRLIGLPGDKIQMIGGVLHINGKPVKRELIGEYSYVEFDSRTNIRSLVRAPKYKETNPEGLSYTVIEARGDHGDRDNTEEYVVPEGHYFMMGDNRDKSEDSRYLSEVGYVPFENLVGRAEIIFFSVDGEASALAFWEWPWTVRWSRLFQVIR